MINKDKIVFNTKTYYTCSWCGAIGVKILKLFDDGCVLVQAGKDPFIRPIQTSSIICQTSTVLMLKG